MAYFAEITDGVVTNVLIADSKEIAELVTGKTCVEYTEDNPVGIGYLYDGKKITAPKLEPVKPDK